ncbi:unnamed protein product [Paramecium sonneborni]|uniref:UBR-type domain-containing protein n=1 Tax=Paramecium sonneborni TaxID=65129 RepID=A0A8S1Q924_9CILI|nr:unnamed protein product [Paramecium sonneborni]
MDANKIDQILQTFYNSQQQLNMEELYNLLISKNQVDLQQNTQKIHSVCGKHILKDNLSFQCFSCSQDFNHMICMKCFDIKKHQNHKFLLQGSQGSCDCGDVNIVELGICDHHQGYAKINKEEILQLISDEIKVNTKILINFLNDKLNKFYQELKPKSMGIIPMFIKIYHLAVKFKLQQILDTLNLQQYYEIFCKAIYYHNLLIQFISWFIQVDYHNIFLITYILQQLDEESNQMILQDIFRRQIIFEQFGPYQGEEIQQIFYLFHADNEFKNLTHSVFLNNFNNFLQFYEVNNEEFNTLQEIYFDLEEGVDLKAKEVKISEQLKQMQIDRTVNKINSIYIFFTTFKNQHTQFCSPKMMEKFFLPENCANFLQDLVECQNKYYQNFIFFQDYSVIHLNLLSLRQNYGWFKNTLYNSLQQILDNKFEQFLNNILTQEECEVFLKKHFFLNELIYSFGNVKDYQANFTINKLNAEQNDYLSVNLIFRYESYQIFIFSTILKGLRSLISQVEGKRNITKIILFQCYQILRKNNLHKQNFQQIDDFLSQYFNKENDSVNQINEGYNLLSLKLLKRPIIINLIFIVLLVLDYFEGQFINNEQFLQYLMQIIEVNSLKDLRQLFDYILIDCLQNWVSFNFDQQKTLYYRYSNINRNSSQIESIDLAFIKFYLFLFGNDGLQSLEKTFQKFQIPDLTIASQIYNQLLLFIMASDLEFWNVLQMVEEKLDICPEQVKASIHQTIINIFNKQSSLSFTEINKYISQLRIKSNKNIENLVQEICQLDKTSKKFTLKKNVKQYFDPIIFQRNIITQGQLLDRLIDQRQTQSFINFGNFIQFKADEIIKQSKSNINQIFIDIFSHLANKSYIIQLIQQIKQQIKQPLQTYQLLNNLLIISSKQQNKIDEEIFEQIKQLQQQLQQEDQKNAKHLNQIIDNLKQLFAIGESVFQQQSQQKQNQDKQKIKDKYLQKQNKFHEQLEADPQQELQQKYDENDYCQSCKLLLDSNDRYTPILVQIFAKQNLYETMPTTLYNLLNSENFNLLNISSCKHSFHFQCLTNSFKSKFDLNLPSWLNSCCPTCKYSCNLLLPLSELEDDYDKFTFEAELVLIELNLDEQFKQKHQKKQELVAFEIFYQVLINILIQIFLQKDDFQRSGKVQIFQQFLKILKYNYNKINYTENLIKFNTGQFFIIDILLLIENYIMKQINEIDFKQNIINILVKVPKKNEDIVKILFSCLAIDYNEKNMKYEQNLKIKNSINEFDTILSEISSQIAIFLGNDFQTFRNQYIQQLRKKCGFYNQNFSNSKDIALCLLCLKTFCLGICNNQQMGNLSSHVEEEHNGNSVFICLSSSKVIITSFPISIINCFTLYYNNLGQELQALTPYNLDWDNFKLDMEKVQQISKIILLNQYQHIVKNKLTNQHTDNIGRNL